MTRLWLTLAMTGILEFTGASLLGPRALAGPSSLSQPQYDPSAAGVNEQNTGLLRQNNITSTGATVPRPGVSQSGGPTPLDRGIERMNDKIQNSICKGC